MLSGATLKLSRSREGKKEAKGFGRGEIPGRQKKLSTSSCWILEAVRRESSNRAADLNRFSSLFFFFLSCLLVFASLHIQPRFAIASIVLNPFTMVWLLPYNHGAAIHNLASPTRPPRLPLGGTGIGIYVSC